MVEASLARRPSPILLIIPLVLTLAGIGLSVMLYLDYTKPDVGSKAVEEAKQRTLEKNQADYRKSLDALASLRSLLGYGGADYLAWLTAQNAGAPDFKTAMTNRETAISDLRTKAKQLNDDDLAALAASIPAALAAKEQMFQTRTAEVLKKLQDLSTLETSYGPRTGAVYTQIVDAGKRLVEKQAEFEGLHAERLAAKDRQDSVLAVLKRQVTELQEVVGDVKLRQQRTDGRVVTVPPGTATVMLDIGRRQRAFSGLRLKVFDKAQVAPDPKDPNAPGLLSDGAKPKAEVEITRVYETQSRASILKINFADPVLPGDALWNPAYEPNLPTHFCLVGLIDLNGDGQDDAEAAARLIQSIGGVIDPRVQVTTDFVVLGANWPTADPVLRERYYRDQEQIKDAEEFGVSFLSIRRFLTYVGVQSGTIDAATGLTVARSESASPR